MSLKRRASSLGEGVAEVVKKKRPLPIVNALVPSGSTLLNLGLSDTPDGALVPGSINNIVGDSSAGKTFLLWTLFAEVARHPAFKKYRLIYDEPERAFYMSIGSLFGLPKDRVETNIRSKTIQEYLVNVLKAVRDGRPFIYGLDSFDSLTTDEEVENFGKLVKSGEMPGSYGMEKPKLSGQLFRNITDAIEQTQSIMIIISQTRTKIGVTFGDKKTRSGGDALRFYSTHEFWLSVERHEKRKEQEVGVHVIAKCKKNKKTGKLRVVRFPIYYDYGVDDIGSCIDFMVEHDFWKKGRAAIECPLVKDGDFLSREKLIAYIEDNNLESELKSHVWEGWKEIEESIKSERKPKYTEEVL